MVKKLIPENYCEIINKNNAKLQAYRMCKNTVCVIDVVRAIHPVCTGKVIHFVHIMYIISYPSDLSLILGTYLGFGFTQLT